MMTESTRQSTSWALLAILVVGVLLAYAPAMGCGYIWDDDDYVTENELLSAVGGLVDIWMPGNTPQYYPAVFTSFWLEYRLWGLDPAGYHVINILLHALNAVLVVRLCEKLRIPGAWFIGAIFALHPVHVESVAWISERKNVLSASFYLAAALTYLRFEERRDQSDGRGRPWAIHAGALGLFVLALLSKTVTCSLPAALILMMLWRRQQLTLRRLLPLVPMFIIGAALALNTIHIERTVVGAEGVDFDFTLADRFLIAGRALLFYPSKILAPHPLVFFYPRWEIEASGLLAFWPSLLVTAAFAAAVAASAKGMRGPFVALSFFAGTILPALGFVDVYPMRYSFVADHFQYLASLGIIALLVNGVRVVVKDRRIKTWGGVAVLVVLGAMTARQCLDYEDEETLWRATIRKNPEAWAAYNNLGEVLSDHNANDEALEVMQQGLALTKAPRARRQMTLNVATLLAKLGRDAEALPHYENLQAEIGGQETRLAGALDRLGRPDEAEAMYRRALETDKRRFALMRFAAHLVRRQRPVEAIPLFEEFITLEPDDVDALMFLSDALVRSGRKKDALRIAERALQKSRLAKPAMTPTIERWIAVRRQ